MYIVIVVNVAAHMFFFSSLFPVKDIHHKVLSLNFSECHTKIRHVDAHATLSDGVVVQVMGLLSNSGQPERKFMQTFVLAPEVSSFHLVCIYMIYVLIVCWNTKEFLQVWICLLLFLKLSDSLNFTYFYVYGCFGFVHHVYAWCPCRPEEGIAYPGTDRQLPRR